MATMKATNPAQIQGEAMVVSSTSLSFREGEAPLAGEI
jgi:hypothetical protein